jgi:transposase-like zinc-binding protein
MGEGSCANRERAPLAGGVYRPRNPRASPLWQCAKRHGAELRASGRLRRALEAQVVERFIRCGDPHHGFARIYCDACGHDYLLAYSCKTRYFCPSCHQKRVLLYGEWVEENVLEPVAHRQYVFTVPRLLRPIFGRHRAWLGEICRIAARLLVAAYAAAASGARPGLILFVQTFGAWRTSTRTCTCSPRTERFFRTDGSCRGRRFLKRCSPRVFGARCSGFWPGKGAISEDLRTKLLGWRYSGFSVHNQVRVGEETKSMPPFATSSFMNLVGVSPADA